MSNKKLYTGVLVFIYKRKRLTMRVFYWDNAESIDILEQALRAGRVVGGSSDTVLGILAELSERSVVALDRIKKRTGKPYVILVADSKRAQSLIIKNELLQIEKLMSMCWPGPVTLIFKAKPGILPFVTKSENTVALRVPDHAGLQILLKRFDGLFSTSANIANTAIPRNVKELDKRITQHLQFFVIDKHPEKKEYLPSTILDCTGSVIKVVREGAYPIEKLEQQLNAAIALEE